MTEDLSNIHMSKAEFQEYGYRLVDWLAEYFDNVGQYQVLPSIEPVSYTHLTLPTTMLV